jgi:hypothetical protein
MVPQLRSSMPQGGETLFCMQSVDPIDQLAWERDMPN